MLRPIRSDFFECFHSRIPRLVARACRPVVSFGSKTIKQRRRTHATAITVGSCRVLIFWRHLVNFSL